MIFVDIFVFLRLYCVFLRLSVSFCVFTASLLRLYCVFLRLYCVFTASLLRLYCVFIASLLRLYCVFLRLSASLLRLYCGSVFFCISVGSVHFEPLPNPVDSTNPIFFKPESSVCKVRSEGGALRCAIR